MNAWDPRELKALESPTEGYVVSGETRGLVQSQRELLRSLGWDLRWDPKTTSYALTGIDGEPPRKDWIEKDPRAYCGRYVTKVFSGTEAEQAEGRGQAKVRIRAEIDIASKGSLLTATYRVFPDGARERQAQAELQDVQLRGNQIATAPVVIKAAWPYFLPKTFEGRFVVPETLIFDGKLFQRQARP